MSGCGSCGKFKAIMGHQAELIEELTGDVEALTRKIERYKAINTELIKALEHAYERLNAIPPPYKDTDFKMLRETLDRAKKGKG